jgi:hypothetical protein
MADSLTQAEKAWAALGGAIERTPFSFYHYAAVLDGREVNHGMCPESAAKGALSLTLNGPCACRPGSDCYGNGGSHRWVAR